MAEFPKFLVHQFTLIILLTSSTISSEYNHETASEVELYTNPTLKVIDTFDNKPVVIAIMLVETQSNHRYSQLPLKTESEKTFYNSLHAPVNTVQDLIDQGYSFKSALYNNKTLTESVQQNTTLSKIILDKIVQETPVIVMPIEYLVIKGEYSRKHEIDLQIYDKLLSRKNVLAIYTEKASSLSYMSWSPQFASPDERLRRRRDELESQGNGTQLRLWSDLTRHLGNIFIYFFEQFPILHDFDSDIHTELSSEMITEGPTYYHDYAGYDVLNVKFTTSLLDKNVTITLRFWIERLLDTKWSFTNVDYENSLNSRPVILTTSSYFGAPLMFSYHHVEDIVFHDGNVVLLMKNIQVQPRVSRLMSPRDEAAPQSAPQADPQSDPQVDPDRQAPVCTNDVTIYGAVNNGFLKWIISMWINLTKLFS